MSHNRRLGNAAEAFVADLLRKESPEALIVPLQQDYGADLVRLGERWTLYEVKSSKTRSRALSARLTPSERNLRDRLGFPNYVVIRVLRHPGRPDTFEVVSRGA